MDNNDLPEMPIFTCMVPASDGRLGWAFWCVGELRWFPTEREAEGERDASLKVAMDGMYREE